MYQRTQILLALVASFTLPAVAQTYKCKDKQGQWTEEACPDYEQRKAAQAQKIISENNKKNWKPQVGMSATEVATFLKDPACFKTSAYKWCGGWKVNSTTTARGNREQWVFKDARGMPLHYLYFDNGTLTTIQE